MELGLALPSSLRARMLRVTSPLAATAQRWRAVAYDLALHSRAERAWCFSASAAPAQHCTPGAEQCRRDCLQYSQARVVRLRLTD